MLNLSNTTDGTILTVKAKPNSRQNVMTGVHDGMLKIAVTAAPEKGKANGAIITVLAKRLSIAKSRIELVSGRVTGTKKFLIQGLSVDQVRILIDDALR